MNRCSEVGVFVGNDHVLWDGEAYFLVCAEGCGVNCLMVVVNGSDPIQFANDGVLLMAVVERVHFFHSQLFCVARIRI